MANDGGEPEHEARGADLGEAGLLDCIARGEEAGIAELVRRHQDLVAQLANRLTGWSQDVEDIVQDVFVSALRGVGKFNGRSKLSTWLTTITINQCRTYKRKAIRWRAMLAGARAAGVFRRWPARPAELPEAADDAPRRVRKAVAALPGRHGEVIVLRYLQEMPVEQVASVLGISANAVRVRLHRARRRLKASLRGLVADEEG